VPGHLREALLGLCLTALCGCAKPRLADVLDSENVVATIELVDTTIAPAKADGRSWDGMEHLPSGIAGMLAEALTLEDPYHAVVDVLGAPLHQQIEKPDPKGTAWIVRNGRLTEARTLRVGDQIDTCTPRWNRTARWEHVRLDSGVRLRVELIDADVAFDDPMGTFELDARTLATIIESGRVYQVQVSEQTQKQVLFAGVSASRE